MANVNKEKIVELLKEFVGHISNKNVQAAAFTEGLLRGELETVNLPKAVTDHIIKVTDQIRESKDFSNIAKYVTDVQETLDNTQRRLDEELDAKNEPNPRPDYQKRNYFVRGGNPYDPSPKNNK
jgi:hypothetical protein